MYENGKIIPTKTIPGMGGSGNKGECGGVELKYEFNSYNLTHYKNFCKCYNVPLSSTTIKKKK
jgi:hypothetical protein